MWKVIGFDLDGTIGNSLPLCIETFHRILKKYTNRSFSTEEITACFGINEIGLFHKLLPLQAEQAYSDYIGLYQELHSQYCPEPFCKMPDVLLDLKEKNIPLVLITGKGPECCNITLAQYGMTDFFMKKYTGSPTNVNKEKHFINILETFHCSPKEFVYVGDAVTDALSAAKAGVACLSAGWAEGTDIAALEKVNQGNVCITIEQLRERLFLPINSH